MVVTGVIDPIDVWPGNAAAATDTEAATTTTAAPATAGAAAAAVANAARQGAHGRRARAQACAFVACSWRTAGRAESETRTASAPRPASGLPPAVSALIIALAGHVNHIFTNVNHFVSYLESWITSRGARVKYGSLDQTSADAD